MTGNIEIRLATLEDLPAIEKVGDELFDNPIKRNRATEFFEDPATSFVAGIPQ